MNIQWARNAIGCNEFRVFNLNLFTGQCINSSGTIRVTVNSERAILFPIDQSSLSNNRARATPNENTPKIRRHKRRKKFTVNTFWFVLEPLASWTRARTSVSRRYSNQLPAVRSDVRADARTPSSSSGRICAFSSWVSFTGEVLPGLSCMRRHTRPAGKPRENLRLSFTYREYSVAFATVFPLPQLSLTPVFVLSRSSAFIRQIDRRDENNLSVFRERDYWCFIEFVRG